MDPLFKSQQILKIVDVFKLQASLFNDNFDCNILPKSFRIVFNVYMDTRITRQFQLLVQVKPITNFSLKLPGYNFTRMWNKIDEQIRNVIHRSKFKQMLHVFYLNTYQSQVKCFNPRCQECN